MRRVQSSAQIGLDSLRFLDKTYGGKEGWKAIEHIFEEMDDPDRSHLNRIGPAGCQGELPQVHQWLYDELAVSCSMDSITPRSRASGNESSRCMDVYGNKMEDRVIFFHAHLIQLKSLFDSH
jgi:hypothetical protein